MSRQVDALIRDRILARQEEHKHKARLARLAGLSYNPDLSHKTADDLVIAVECGDVSAVIDLLDKREDGKDPDIDPRIPVNAVNTDGVTPTFAALNMILHHEVLDTEVNFDDLGLTRVQRLWRRLTRLGGKGKKKKKKQQQGQGEGEDDEVRLDVVLQVLLHYGGSLDFYRVTEKDAFSMLHYAAMQGSVEMLDWLLARGVSVHQCTRPGQRTALMLAVERNHLEAVMCLLRHGAIAGIHALDAHGNNVLHYAARAASLVLVKILLLCGAKASVRNQAAQLPAEKARAMNRFDVSRLLAACKSGDKDGVSRVDFLYATELCGGEDHTSEKDEDEEKEEEEEKERDVGEAGGAGSSRQSLTETSLAMQAMRKRAQSYRVNKMWKQSLEESSRVLGPVSGTGAGATGRRGSSVLVLRPQSAGPSTTAAAAKEISEEPTVAAAAAAVVRTRITHSATTVRANQRLRSPLMMQANGEVPAVDRTRKRRGLQQSFMRPQSAKT